jgi:hypothetical protein
MLRVPPLYEEIMTIPRKYGCGCVALFEGGRQNTAGNSVFTVTKKIAQFHATTQLAVPKKNMNAPDQKSFKIFKIFENRLPNRRNQ